MNSGPELPWINLNRLAEGALLADWAGSWGVPADHSDGADRKPLGDYLGDLEAHLIPSHQFSEFHP